MADLTGEQLKNSYQNLVTIDATIESNPTSGQLENGLGNAITALGIGTDAPNAKLNVDNGHFLRTNSTNTTQENIILQGAGYYIGSTLYGNVSIRSDYNQVSNQADLRFYTGTGATNTDEKLRIEADGDIAFYDDANNQGLFWDASEARLGIGTTSPAYPLDVNGTVQIGAGVTGLLRFNASAFGQIVSATRMIIDSDTHDFRSGSGSDFMRIDSSGNVGIGGTADSDYRLHLYKSTNSEMAFESTGVGGGFFRIGTGHTASGFGGSLRIYDVNQSAERLRVDSSGNLLVGTTSTPTSSAGNIVLGNGTAPTGNATNGVILYAEDVSTSSELKVRDEAGNVTTLSPHNFSLIPDGASEPMAWAYYSERDGKKINVDMLKLARMVESLTGEKLVYEQ